MIRIGNRESQYHWNDLLMWGEDSQHWLTERVRFTSIAASEAKPAIYTLTITRENGSSTADKTFIVGGQTFTAKASPSTSAGTTEYALDATAAQIATIIAAKGLTNYTVTASGANVIFTQTTAGTGSAVTVGDGNDTNVTGTIVTTQEAQEAVTGVDYNIMAGEPVSLVSTGTDGVKNVTPTSAASGSETYSTFIGFIMEPLTVKNGAVADVAICSGRCRLNIDKMLKKDSAGNSYDWSVGSTTLRGYAEAKGFKFGRDVSGIEYTK